MKKKETTNKKKAEAEAEADRISNLPDSVLCHILSFLPTDAAVATSVLSQRWNPLWRSVSSLEFSDQGENDNDETYLDFVQFVYAVLLSRDWDQPIQSFSLSCYSSFSDYYHVKVWVNAALQRRVQHLSLSLPVEIGFPSAILNCKTLVVLKLRYSTFYEPFSSSVDLPSLKTLHMNNVNFLEDKHLPELLSGAPNLEDFEAIYFHLLHDYPIEAKFRRMPKLIRARVTHLLIPLNVVSNVRFLSIFWVTNEEGRVRNPYYKGLIPHFHNLTDLKVEDARLESNEHWREMLHMLTCCPKLQILDIEIKQICALSGEEDAGSDWSYPVTGPSCISSHLQICRLNGYGGSRGEFRFVTYVMRSALHLEAMAICCAEDVDQGTKLEMLKELSFCPRLSASCVLSFE